MIKGLIAKSDGLPEILCGRTVQLDLREPCIVGILNVTPDSFSDGGRFHSVDAALKHGLRMAAEGASLIDVGGESTRPGAPAVSAADELARVIPVIQALRSELATPLSIDTNKSAVAEAAIKAGVEFVNDVSGLTFDAGMADVVAASGAGLIVMHTRGRPDIMQQDTVYKDVVAEVTAGLRRSVEAALGAGMAKGRIAVDPGIGFGKDDAGNLELLRCTSLLTELGCPVMLGTSRKSFIGRILSQDDPGARLPGSLATVALGYAAGARLFRVHDVAASWQAARMAQAVCKGADWPN